MGKMLDDCITIQKMHGVYHTPMGAATRKIVEDLERELQDRRATALDPSAVQATVNRRGKKRSIRKRAERRTQSTRRRTHGDS